jgi:23S rRNA (cytidine1920-2'-O)/16S rRNA (cytidine1409-2'-O)-methyltransferase
MRLDALLVQKGLAPTREKARALILAGAVEINGALADKAGKDFPPDAEIILKQDPNPYVSRGGLKLEAALRHFGIDVTGLTMLDVGASTGGFTDCLLQHGAAAVIAVDVGYGQLAWKLRQDPRVKVLEKTNIRHLHHLEEEPAGAVIDVSFISLKIVIPAVARLLPEKAFLIALIKPQFEVGKGKVGKGGVVRDPALHNAVIEELFQFSKENGWDVVGHIPSPILGPKGNKEFLLYLTRG